MDSTTPFFNTKTGEQSFFASSTRLWNNQDSTTRGLILLCKFRNLIFKKYKDRNSRIDTRTTMRSTAMRTTGFTSNWVDCVNYPIKSLFIYSNDILRLFFRSPSFTANVPQFKTKTTSERFWFRKSIEKFLVFPKKKAKNLSNTFRARVTIIQRKGQRQFLALTKTFAASGNKTFVEYDAV